MVPLFYMSIKKRGIYLITTVDNQKIKNKEITTRYSAALLKVASRCNLNCDYCYVYQHEDQSWMNQPKFMSEQTIARFAERLNEYIKTFHVQEFDVIFHGGEPLLYTSERLVQAVQIINTAVTSECTINYSIQTNGTLLTGENIRQLFDANISVSMSLDGPKEFNDLHRLDHSGCSTFKNSFAGLQKLIETGSENFKGVIAVIDPKVPPKMLFDFFSPLQLPRLDFLLPDSTHENPPIGRGQNEELYVNWLLEAFELWFHRYPDIPVRWFDSIISSRLGIPSQTDVMGFGEVSLLVIETDGSYTDHDVFKITKPNGAILNGTVYDTSFIELSKHATIQEHGFRLSVDGVSDECRRCPALEACGGGSVPHRYHKERGLDAPTVYCNEIYQLVSKASKLLRESLDFKADANFDFELLNGKQLLSKAVTWKKNIRHRAEHIAQENNFKINHVSPTAVILRAMSSVNKDMEFTRMGEEPLTWMDSIAVQSEEKWLVEPFKDTIKFLERDSKEFYIGYRTLDKVKSYLEFYDPELTETMSILISDLLFVQSTLGDEEGIFSFSDDTAPNVLYIAPTVKGEPLKAEDLGDSILHEFLHQILYHMGREGEFLFDHSFPRFSAPWRAGLRPAGGFLHGTFVFTHLSLYWESLSRSQFEEIDKQGAKNNADKFKEQALFGINSLYNFSLLTPRGIKLLDKLAEKLNINNYKSLSAPGKL